MNYFLLSIITVMVLVGCGGAEERKEVYLEKAKLSLEAGDLDKARIELKNVLQIDPKDAKAYFQLGNIFEQTKDYKKAFRNYLKAVELAPENPEYQATIGTYHLMVGGDIDTAIEKRDLILEKDSANINGLLLKAGILYKQNDVTGAKKITQDNFSMQPGHVHNSLFLSLLYISDKEYENSINVLNACIKENPRDRSLAKALANSYFIAGKNDLAEKEYKKILERKPGIFNNYLILASFYKDTGSTDKAENILRKAIEEDTDDVKRKIALVDLIRQTRGNKSAIDELKYFVSKNRGMGKLRLSLAELYITEKNQDDAEKVLKAAVLDFSDDSVGIKSRVHLAQLYMQKENIDAAVSILDEAVKISPNDSEVNFIKGKIQLIHKDYEYAIISLRNVIKDDPENVVAYILLSAALEANGEEEQAVEIIRRAYENNRTNENGLMKLAAYHASNKNNDELEKVVDRYLSVDPDNYEALSYKSKILNEKKMFSEAKVYASKMIKLYPNMPNGYIHSVPYLHAENKISDAVILIKDAYSRVTDNGTILKLLASLYVSQKDFEAATSMVRSAILDKGETAELNMLIAKIELSSNKIEDAKASLLKVVSIKPVWDEAYFQLAKIYMDEKQNSKAMDILQRGLAETKNDLKLSLTLANLYESLNDFSSAINVYEKAYEKNPDNVILINNFAVVLSDHGIAVDSMKRAVELVDKLKNEKQPVLLDTVGWVYYKSGNYAEAVNILKTVVEKSPDVAVFNYHYGMALYKAGDMVAAKIYLTVSLENNPDFQGKDDAEAHLKKLQ